MDRETRSHLKGIVAIWLTNGQKPVDGANDTRYDFFDGGWMEAADATEELIEGGYVANVIGTGPEATGEGEIHVTPTARGIYEAMS
jgi:hypothetical protein